MTKSEILCQFEGALAKLKYEFEKNLMEIDPLNREALEGLLSVFSQRLIIFQHEFLEHLSKVLTSIDPSTEEFNFEPPPATLAPEIAAGILTSGSGVLLVSLIPVGTRSAGVTLQTATDVGGYTDFDTSFFLIVLGRNLLQFSG